MWVLQLQITDHSNVMPSGIFRQRWRSQPEGSACVGKGGCTETFNKRITFQRGQPSVPKVRDLPRNIPAGKEGRALKVRVSCGARLPGFDS